MGGPRSSTELKNRINDLDRDGLSLRQIAAQTGVWTATARVALGRVAADSQATTTSEPTSEPAPEAASEPASVAAGLVVLAGPVARTAERVAARFGDLTEAPVVITQGAQLPLAGLLLALPALEMTGLLGVAEEVFTPMRKGFYGLRATLLMTLFLGLASGLDPPVGADQRPQIGQQPVQFGGQRLRRRGGQDHGDH